MKFKAAVFVIVFCLLTFGAAQADDFSVEFSWGDIPLCTTGNPNTVDNPRFTISGVPEGTQYLSFSMTDLDVPSYDHGGGGIEYTGQTVIEPGAFRYQSPCPPSGSHRYQWTVTAKNKKGLFAKNRQSGQGCRCWLEKNDAVMPQRKQLVCWFCIHSVTIERHATNITL